MSFNSIFTKLGLTEKESKIYEASLELGPETIQSIARRAGIKRTGAYGHVKNLIKKGLMASNTRDKKTYFFAEPPENLSLLLTNRKKETIQLMSDLQKAIPKLRILFETNEERPHVRFFEGKEGLKTMINDITKSKFTSLEEFTPLDEAYAFSPPQPNDYRQRVQKKLKNIPRKIIYTSAQGPILKQKEGLKERRYLPKKKFPFTGSVTIYGNKVSLVSQRKTVTGVIVENKEIAQTLRVLFNLAWEATGRKR